MKWIRFCSAVVATLGLTTAVQAGSLNLFGSSSFGHGKCCAPAKTSAPKCCAPTKSCRPTITKPCCPTVHTYQRQKSSLKKPCCHKACAPTKSCAPTKCSSHGSFLSHMKNKWGSHSCAPTKSCAPTSCAPTKCCDADPCEIAEWIYKSQTSCYAKDRKRAVHKLGRYDCKCNPEIMVALIYALNDADERVRKEAADEIGDVLNRNSCCCSKEVTAALTAALGDCDHGVVHQAARALEVCGYDVVNGCCKGVSCNPCDKKVSCAPTKGCAPYAAPAPLKKAAPAPPKKAAPAAPQKTAPAAPQKTAPAPPVEPKAYFPSHPRQEQTSRPRRRFGRLAQLFGLNR